MSKKKRQKGKKKFPNIYRYIPAWPDRIIFFRVYRRFLKGFISILFILVIILVWYDLSKNIEQKRVIDKEREKLTNELKFWDNFLAKNKGYRDAYFQASIVEYKLGDSDKARDYVKMGLALDQNSEEGKNILKFLNGK